MQVGYVKLDYLSIYRSPSALSVNILTNTLCTVYSEMKQKWNKVISPNSLYEFVKLRFAHAYIPFPMFGISKCNIIPVVSLCACTYKNATLEYANIIKG